MNQRKLIDELNENTADPELEVVIVLENGEAITIHEVCYNSHTNQLDLLGYNRFKNLE